MIYIYMTLEMTDQLHARDTCVFFFLYNIFKLEFDPQPNC